MNHRITFCRSCRQNSVLLWPMHFRPVHMECRAAVCICQQAGHDLPWPDCQPPSQRQQPVCFTLQQCRLHRPTVVFIPGLHLCSAACGLLSHRFSRSDPNILVSSAHLCNGSRCICSGMHHTFDHMCIHSAWCALSCAHGCCFSPAYVCTRSRQQPPPLHTFLTPPCRPIPNGLHCCEQAQLDLGLDRPSPGRCCCVPACGMVGAHLQGSLASSLGDSPHQCSQAQVCLQ